MSMIVSPVQPFQGFRGVDAHGGGGFGAPRGSRKHPGQDFIGNPGDTAVAVMLGSISRIGMAYNDDPSTELDESELGSIHIFGKGPSKDMWAKVLYVKPDPSLTLGSTVQPGQTIGVVQDRNAYVKDKDIGPMTNHVHLTLKIRDLISGKWRVVNPTHYFMFPLEGYCA